MTFVSTNNITVKLDIDSGTTLTRGVSSIRHSYASRLAMATGIDPTVIGREQAAQAFIGTAGIVHPTDPNLYLFRVSGIRRYGPDKAFGLLEYRPSNVVAPSSTVIRWRSYYESVRVYRSLNENGLPVVLDGGLPAGRINIAPANLGDQDKRPWWRVWTRPVLTMLVPFELAVSPINATFGLEGHINDATADFGEYSFLKHTLRYDGLASDWAFRNFVNTHTGAYKFTVTSGGHYGQEPFFNIATNKWEVLTELDFPQAPFGGAFPLNT